MTRVAHKSVKFLTYALTALVGAVLVLFGFQARDAHVTDGELPVRITDVAHADHGGGGGDTGGGWTGGDDDDDDGGGDGGGG